MTTDRVGALRPGTRVMCAAQPARHIPRDSGVVLARSAPWPGFCWVLIANKPYLRHERELTATEGSTS
jgi:hypothetical protein